MKKKIIGIFICLLFVGVCVPSAVSNEDKASTSENEKPISKSGEVYENTNCFIIGSFNEAYNLVYQDDKICVGWFEETKNIWHPGNGRIYTNGDNGKWMYNSFLMGNFYGDLGTFTYVHWWLEEDITHYVAIKDFRGLAYGAWFVANEKEPIGGHCFFIGFAKNVKISNSQPRY